MPNVLMTILLLIALWLLVKKRQLNNALVIAELHHGCLHLRCVPHGLP